MMAEINRDAFNVATTTDEVLEGIDLTGTCALVTGGASGLGAETVRALASKGAEVVIAARNHEKAEEVRARVQEETGNDKIHIEELELASLAKVRDFAERCLSRYDRLHLLINNAGVMACPQGKTEDGFELQFGSNHLGHFLMTCLIMPKIIKAAPSRIVSLSSLGHRFSPVVFDDIHFERRPYDKWLSYGQSKTANALFAVALEKRLQDKSVHAYAVHPGIIITRLGRHLTQEDITQMQSRYQDRDMPIKSVEAGAATSVYAATAPELEGQGGVYLEDCHIAVEEESADAESGVRPYAADSEQAERLWTVSEEMIGQKFSF